MKAIKFKNTENKVKAIQILAKEGWSALREQSEEKSCLLTFKNESAFKEALAILRDSKKKIKEAAQMDVNNIDDDIAKIKKTSKPVMKILRRQSPKQYDLMVKKLSKKGYSSLEDLENKITNLFTFKKNESASREDAQDESNSSQVRASAEMINHLGRAYNELRSALSVAATNDFQESAKALKSFIEKDMKKLNKVISNQKIKGEATGPGGHKPDGSGKPAHGKSQGPGKGQEDGSGIKEGLSSGMKDALKVVHQSLKKGNGPFAVYRPGIGTEYFKTEAEARKHIKKIKDEIGKEFQAWLLKLGDPIFRQAGIKESKAKKGSVFSPKDGVKLKVIEPARGFVKGRDKGFWVRVIEGSWQGYKKGEEFTMQDKTVQKYLGKKMESKHDKRLENLKKMVESFDGYVAESKLEKDLEKTILDYIGNAATGESVEKLKANIIDLVKKLKKKNPEYLPQMQDRVSKLMKAVGVDDKDILNYIRELLEGR